MRIEEGGIMIKHETPRWPVGDGLPWVRIKVGEEHYHLRMPGRALGNAVTRRYIDVCQRHSALLARVKAIEEAAKAGTATEEDATAAMEALEAVQDEVDGVLGTVMLASWHDPHVELHTVRAWALQSAYMRRRFGKAQYEADEQTEAIQASANALARELGIDIRAAYGLLVSDELREELGWSFRTFDKVATSIATVLIKEQTPGLADADVEVVADFSPALTANAP